jgi:hypothetical protein
MLSSPHVRLRVIDGIEFLLFIRKMDMIEQKPASPQKNTIWIWIVVAIAAVLLLCLVLLVGAGAYTVWKGYIIIPGINVPALQSPSIPHQIVPPATNPKGTVNKITVEPYQPQRNDPYPTLQNLATNWQNPTGPSSNTYDIAVSANQPVLLTSGWCATTKAILDQNFQHIKYLVEVDGQSLETSKLYQQSLSSVDQSCKDFVGIIHAWPTGNHTIKITMRLDAKINDGWSDYAAGDYAEIYSITVTQ